MKKKSGLGSGIEFLIIGSAKSGKTAIAREMAVKYKGSYFNMSTLNRLIAWLVLHAKQHNPAFDLYDKRTFPIILDQVISKTIFKENGDVFYDKSNITGQIESDPVSIQAANQSDFVYQNYKVLLTPIIWQVINRLKQKGPVFIVARKRSSVITVHRAVYLEADVHTRSRRYRMINPKVSLKQAYKIIADRDQLERTYLEKGLCDAIIDTTSQTQEETLNAVALEYEKTRLTLEMDFYSYRYIYGIGREKGREVLAHWLEIGKKFFICCADLDSQNRYTNSFGRNVDVIAGFLSILLETACELGGIPIIWGMDDVIILFPFTGKQGRARLILELLRKRYLLRNFQKFAIGVIESRNGKRTAAGKKERKMIGEFTGSYAGEELFLFNIPGKQDIKEAFNRQLDYINGKLRGANVVLSGRIKGFVPLSTVTIGALFVEDSPAKFDVDNLIDASYRVMSEAKNTGKNCVRVVSLRDHDSIFHLCNQPIITDKNVIAEIENQPEVGFPIPEMMRREHYPFVYRITALEPLVTYWLNKKGDKKPKFLIALNPGFSGENIEKMLDDIIKKGELKANDKKSWMLPNGYRLKALAKVYSQKNREIFIKASVHYAKITISKWLQRINRNRNENEKIKIACIDGTPLAGLRLSFEEFWFFEGICNDTEVFDLLYEIKKILQEKIPGFCVKTLAIKVALDKVFSGRAIFSEVNIFSDFVSDANNQEIDGYGNILINWDIKNQEYQLHSKLESKMQYKNLTQLEKTQQKFKLIIPYLKLENDLWEKYDEYLKIKELKKYKILVYILLVFRAIQVFKNLRIKQMGLVIGQIISTSSEDSKNFSEILYRSLTPRQQLILGKYLKKRISLSRFKDNLEILGMIIEHVNKHGLYLLELPPLKNKWQKEDIIYLIHQIHKKWSPFPATLLGSEVGIIFDRIVQYCHKSEEFRKEFDIKRQRPGDNP